ncbi:MAG: hypothetical protein AB7E08_06610, partial [Candidatus Omnitrophota bacterium]
MKHLSKVLRGFSFLLVLGIFYASLSYAEEYYPPRPQRYDYYDSFYYVSRMAADHIVSYINYFTDGSASVIPPDKEKRYYYTIEIKRQPSCCTLDVEYLNYLIESVITERHRLKAEALERGISLEERIKQYVDEKLREWYPQFMAEVDRKAEEYRAELRCGLNEILGISDKSELSEVEQKQYDKMIEDYIEEIKDGFHPENQIKLVRDYMVGLKDAVADFIKTATGEDFKLFNSLHAGLLTYWAEWAFSYKYCEGVSIEEAINEAISAINDRKALVKDVNKYIFNGKGDIFSGEFGRVLSYFADKVVVEGKSIDEIKEEIRAFGGRFSKDREVVEGLVERLTGGNIDTEEKEKIVEKFTLMLLAKLFEKFDKEAMDEFVEANKNDPGMVDEVKYSRYQTEAREWIKAEYVCPLGVSDFFEGVEHQEVLGTLKQYVDDMLTINEAFKKRFGQSYDTTTLKGVEGLLGWALWVEGDMKDLLEKNKGMSV